MQNAVTKAVRSSLFGLLLIISHLAFADVAAPLKPDADQKKAAMDLVQRLDNEHYRKQELNDALSSRYFDEYLKSLDGSKNFFLQSDVKSFEKYRHSFDDLYK